MGTSKYDVLYIGPSRAQRRFRYMGDETHAEVVLSRTELERSFNSGYDFRAFYEFNISAGTTQVIKVVSTIDTVVRILAVELDAGSLSFELVNGGTEGGTFNGNITVWRSNTMTTCPERDIGVTFTTNGTHTGGTVVDKFSLAATNQTGPAYLSEDLPIGFAPGTFYLRLVNGGNQSATGIFRARWEERPNGSG